MRTARQYLAREIYRSTTVVLVALVGLFMFFALIEGLDKVGDRLSLLNLFYLQALDLQLRTGEITGVVGENGNGKTTLLRIVAGDLLSDSGDMEYPILDLKAGQWYAIRNQVAFIPQRLSRWRGTAPTPSRHSRRSLRASRCSMRRTSASTA